MAGLLHLSTPIPRLSHAARLLALSPILSATTASFSSTRRALAEAHPLAFPTKPNPSPLDIFHLPADADWSAKMVKERYYDLCRLYHPDLRKGKERADALTPGSGDTSSELKQINLAYEILRNPTKRSVYLRSGVGWGGAGGHRRHGPATNPGYDFTRGRPMGYGGTAGRGPYPSAAWDWTDPHNPHFRPGFAGGAGDGAAGAGGGSAPGWSSRGLLAHNGVVFLALCSITLLVTPLTLWSATPSMGDSGDESQGLMVGDRRHREAARALEQARREARDGGIQKREAIARRVRQIERARAAEQAREMEIIERSTGARQLQLPAPPPSSAGLNSASSSH